jgi:carlactone synthase/all-trans-10'-apo-beta-carotenal 13,14-cleaving dioxygenase
MASSLYTLAALFGRRASCQKVGKRRAAQPQASPRSVVAPVVRAPARRGLEADADQLVAWKSVQQERWEGALQVEGKLPLWLVGDPKQY